MLVGRSSVGRLLGVLYAPPQGSMKERSEGVGKSEDECDGRTTGKDGSVELGWVSDWDGSASPTQGMGVSQ